MRHRRTILLVEDDPGYAQALSLVLRSQGDRVEVAQSAAEARAAARNGDYDVAIVDLFTRGGGTELARELAMRVPRLVLSHGAAIPRNELLQAALGFPVCRKAMLPALLTGRGASSTGKGSAGKRRVARRLAPAATGSSRGPRARARRRARPG
jgi:CheY-like chemotaxis protein